MDLAQLIRWLVTVSLLLMVFGLGLRATWADATFLIRHLFQPPHRLLRAIVVMFIVVPAIAVVIAKLFDLPEPVKLALLAMAISPVPPILPGKQIKFGGEPRFVYGLLIAMSLASVAVVPLAVELLGWIFQRDAHIGASVIAKAIAVSVLGPLVAGLFVRQWAPGFAQRAAPWVARVGTLLLVAGAALILAHAWPAVVSLIGKGAVVAFAVLVALAVAAGALFGGPDPHDRIVLAIASPMRHPGVALAIAHATFPDDVLAPAAILLLLLMGVLATSIYGRLLKRRASGPRAPA
jgi:BASS family bile acid:Na+ symporter